MKKSKKTFKRVLAIALAAIMVGSSFPIASLAAASNAENLLNLAIDNYKNKMDGTIYKNMAPAYDAYIDALTTLDAVKYGGIAESELTAVTNNLNEKVTAMTSTVWNRDTEIANAKASYVTPSFRDDGLKGVTTDGYVVDVTHANLLYSPQCSASNVTGDINQNGTNVELKICYPTTVMVYDGVNTPKMPVMYITKSKVSSSRTATDYRYCFGVYPTDAASSLTDNPYIKLDSYWRSSSANGNSEEHSNTPNKLDFTGIIYDLDEADNWHLQNGPGYNKNTGHDKITNSNKGCSLPGTWKGTSYERYAANVMQFKPSTALPSNQYSMTIDSTSWYARMGGGGKEPWHGIGQKVEAINDAPAEGYVTATGHPIYVLNTKTVYDAIEAASARLNLGNAPASRINSAQTLATLQLFDKATSFNLADKTKYDFASTTLTTADVVASATKDIKDCVEGLAAATFGVDNIPTGYDTLRAAMDAAKPTIDKGSKGYTAETWQPFADAYQAAVDHMKTLLDPNVNYDDNTANTLAATLNSTKDALVTDIKKVDTTQLEGVIDNADVLIQIKGFLKASDSCATDFETAHKNLIDTIKAAKVAVWNSEANYRVSVESLDDSPENIAIVNEQIRLIGECVKNFAINFDAPVPKAQTKSMNTWLAEAAQITPGDYVNYYILGKAIKEANDFKALGGLFESKQGSCVTVVMQYVDKTKAIMSAISNLSEGFASTKNGTVIDSGNIVNVGIFDSLKNQVWNLASSYQDEMVLFRTSHDAVDFNLGTANISFTSTANYPQVLDSFSIDDKVDNLTVGDMHDPDAGEITSNSGGDQNIPMSEIQKSKFPGKLHADVVSEGVTASFKVDGIYVTSTQSTYQGRDLQGNGIAKDAVFDWTSALSTTEGEYPYRGGVEAREHSTTSLTANYKLGLSATTSYPLTELNNSNTIPKMYTFAPQGLRFGAVVKWQYHPNTSFYEYQGYGHHTGAWNPVVKVIDVSYLFDLAKECSNLNRNDYSKETYDVMATAIIKANAIDYSTLTPDQIVTECQARYTELYNAYKGLHKHDWNTPVFTIAEDGSLTSCTVTCRTANCPDSPKDLTVEARASQVIDHKKLPTPTSSGIDVYKYSVTFNGQTYNAQKEVITENLGLQYILVGEPTINEQRNLVTFKLKTNEDGSQPQNYTTDKISKTTTKAADCVSKGTVLYEASYTINEQTFNFSKSYDDLPIDANNHVNPVEYPYEAPTQTNGYIGHTAGIKCDQCNADTRVEIDANSYINAIKKAEDLKKDPNYENTFDQAGKDALDNTINSNNIDDYLNNPPRTNPEDAADIQNKIDDAAAKITEATNNLDNHKLIFNVEFVKVVYDEQGIASEETIVPKTEYKYGAVYKANAASALGNGHISKWDIKSLNSNNAVISTTPINVTEDLVEFTVTSDAKITVYVTQEPVDAQNYTKITLYNQVGKVYNITYTQQDVNQLNLKYLELNGELITPPSVPFYTFNGWVPVQSTTGEYNLKADYTFNDVPASYSRIYGVGNVTIEGLQKLDTAKYDEPVRLSGATANQVYALVTDATAKTVITYLNSTTHIHVPHRINGETIYVAAIDKSLATASTGITGTLIKDRPGGKRGATFNCTFYLPEGATLIECGALGTNKAEYAKAENFLPGTTSVAKFKSDKQSSFNEYNIIFTANFPKDSKFFGRSYLVYLDAQGQKQTLYGNIVEIAL